MAANRRQKWAPEHKVRKAAIVVNPNGNRAQRRAARRRGIQAQPIEPHADTSTRGDCFHPHNRPQNAP